MSNAIVPLTHLKAGQSAVVKRFSPSLAASCRKLLQTLGIHPTTRITLVRRAPFGDPLQLNILGSQFCLRASEACHIYVEYSNEVL